MDPDSAPMCSRYRADAMPKIDIAALCTCLRARLRIPSATYLYTPSVQMSGHMSAHMSIHMSHVMPVQAARRCRMHDAVAAAKLGALVSHALRCLAGDVHLCVTFV